MINAWKQEGSQLTNIVENNIMISISWIMMLEGFDNVYNVMKKVNILKEEEIRG